MEGGELRLLLNKLPSWLMVSMTDPELDREELRDLDLDVDELDRCEFPSGS